MAALFIIRGGRVIGGYFSEVESKNSSAIISLKYSAEKIIASAAMKEGIAMRYKNVNYMRLKSNKGSAKQMSKPTIFYFSGLMKAKDVVKQARKFMEREDEQNGRSGQPDYSADTANGRVSRGV